MRSYENSGYNPYNDNYRSETRSSGRNYYTSDAYGLGNSGSSRGSYSSRGGGFGTGRDAYSDSGYGHTSTYGRSAGSSSYGSGSSDYGSSRSGWTGSSHDRDRQSGRDTWDRAGDEVKSWFGDDDAERRRRMDEMRDRSNDRDYSSSYNRGYSSGYSSYNPGSSYSSGNYGGSHYGSGSGSGYGSSGSTFGMGATYGTGYSTGFGSSGYGSTSSYDRDRYSSSSYDRDRYSSDWDRNRDSDNDRGFFERAGDEVKSWFGDEEAERRRRMDEMRDRSHDNDYDRYGSSSSYRSGSTYSGPPYSYGSSSRRDYEW